MPAFTRAFDVAAFSHWLNQSADDTLVHHLFRRWSLPGEISNEDRLRVAVRGGYLNLYAKGQSVAKLSLAGGAPKLELHNAYVEGRTWEKAREHGAAKGYRKFAGEDLLMPHAHAEVAKWIDTALTYASAEKRFVDDLVGANPGVLDLEMGLPASDALDGSDRVAPRMDIVLVDNDPANGVTIAFWEAKCANNTELRASGETMPKVVGQLERYVKWTGSAARLAEVRFAYREGARVMLGLQALFRPDAADAPAVTMWRALSGKEPAIEVNPGIVIGNYWPNNPRENVASGRMAQCASSFARSHRHKLVAKGIAILEIASSDAELALDLPGRLAA